MRRIVTTTVAAAALALTGTAAVAGSDSPTPYTVDTTGITLPTGTVFRDNGHVNVHTTAGNFNVHFEAKCITRTDAECAGTRHTFAQYIGASHLPWTVVGVPADACVKWVQLSDFQEHYGEGGQPPVCLTEVPCPTTTPTSVPSSVPSPPWTPSPTSSPSDEPSTTPSPEPTTDPTGEPTPTGSPTVEPPVPTAGPSVTPTVTPSNPSSPSPTVSIAAPPIQPTSSPAPSGTPTQTPGVTRSSDELAATGVDRGLLVALGLIGGLSVLIGWGLVYKARQENGGQR